MKLAFAFLLLLFIPQVTFGQSLKKKYLGIYSGTIPPYSMDAGGEVITAKSAEVVFTLEESKATRQLMELR